MPSSRPSIAELRAVGQPAGVVARYSGEHWAGRLYARRVSVYVTWALVRLGVSANAITIVMALVGMAGAAAFAVRGLVFPVAGAVLIQVYLLLDCSDGEVARWRGTTGAAGIFLDRLGHYAVEATLFVALGARASLGRGDQVWLAAGLAVALIHVLGKVETDLVHMARAKAGLPVADDDERTAMPARGGLAAVRRAARALPVYRLTGAIEASLVSLAALIVAEAVGGDWTAGLVVGFGAAATVVLGGHLLMILASSRLRA